MKTTLGRWAGSKGGVCGWLIIAAIGAWAAVVPARAADTPAAEAPADTTAVVSLRFTHFDATQAELAHQVWTSASPVAKSTFDKGTEALVSIEYGMPRYDITVDQIAAGQWLPATPPNPAESVALVEYAGKYRLFATVGKDKAGKTQMVAQSLSPNLQEITITPEKVAAVLAEVATLPTLKTGTYEVGLVIVHGVTANGNPMLAISLKSADANLLYIPNQQYVPESVQRGALYTSSDCRDLLKPFALKMYAAEQAVAQQKYQEMMAYTAYEQSLRNNPPTSSSSASVAEPVTTETPPAPSPPINPQPIYPSQIGTAGIIIIDGGDSSSGSTIPGFTRPQLPTLRRPELPTVNRPQLPSVNRPQLPEIERPELPSLPQPQRPTLPQPH